MLKITINKSYYSNIIDINQMSKFCKNKDNLRLHIRVYADLFVTRFSRLRSFLISMYNFRLNELNYRLVELRNKMYCKNCNLKSLNVVFLLHSFTVLNSFFS